MRSQSHAFHAKAADLKTRQTELAGIPLFAASSYPGFSLPLFYQEALWWIKLHSGHQVDRSISQVGSYDRNVGYFGQTVTVWEAL